MKRLITAAALCFAVALGPAAQGALMITALPTPLELHDDFFGSFEPVDVDASGTVDFTFGYNFSAVGLRTERSNRAVIRLVGAPTIGGRITPLELGYDIAPALTPTGFDTREWASSDYLGGYVSPGESAFHSIVFVASTGSATDFSGRGPIGVEFEASDGLHYGYIDISAGPGYAGITLYGWAYESQPLVPVSAGQVPEPSHGMLIASALLTLLAARNRRTR